MYSDTGDIESRERGGWKGGCTSWVEESMVLRRCGGLLGAVTLYGSTLAWEGGRGREKESKSGYE